MESTKTEYKHILLWPDGTPTVSGTRLKVKHVAAAHRSRGLGPDELVESFPPHTLGEMYCALAYYYDHKEAIDHELDEDDRQFVQEQAAAWPTSLLRAKLQALGPDV